MASFDEDIVREYFELNQFFVRQLQKHFVYSGRKTDKDIVGLLIYNPAVSQADPGTKFQLFSADMTSVQQALVLVHNWQYTRVTPTILKNNKRLFDFLKREALNPLNALPSDLAGTGENLEAFRKIAVIPGFPTTNPYRDECIALFKERGIDNVIAFSTILEDCLRQIEMNHSYNKSKLLQLMRVLKIYDMIQSPQMRLF